VLPALRGVNALDPLSDPALIVNEDGLTDPTEVSLLCAVTVRVPFAKGCAATNCPLLFR
jgi:hypothetical protein